MTIERILGVSAESVLVAVTYLFFHVPQSLEKGRSETRLFRPRISKLLRSEALASPDLSYSLEALAFGSGVNSPRTWRQHPSLTAVSEALKSVMLCIMPAPYFRQITRLQL